jgi:hypothetical protein
MGKVFTGVLIFLILIAGKFTALGQKNLKRYEVTVLFVSGFKDRGILEEVKDDGIIINDGRGSRLIESGGISKISIRPYRSGKKAFFAGTLAGAAGAGLTYGIKQGHGQKMNKGSLPGLVLSAGAITGGYFWLLNSVIRTVVFRDVNHPEKFKNLKPRLEKLSVAVEEKL